MTIRDAKEDDAAAVLAIYSYYVLETAISFETTVPEEAEMRERIRTYSSTHPFLVAEEDGRIVGYCYAHPLSPRQAYYRSVELSVYVDKDSRGRGVGSRLYTHLEDRLKAQDVHAMYAIVTFPDSGSIAFHEKNGFRIVGKLTDCGEKFGEKWSVVYMEKHLAP